MGPAPKQIGGANVVLYTPIDERHRPTGNCHQIVAGVVQGPAAGLAICQYDDEDCFYLFGCDEDWFSVTDTCISRSWRRRSRRSSSTRARRPRGRGPPLKELSSTRYRKRRLNQAIGRTRRQAGPRLLHPGGSAQWTEWLASRCSGPGPPRRLLTARGNPTRAASALSDRSAVSDPPFEGQLAVNSRWYLRDGGFRKFGMVSPERGPRTIGWQ